MRNLIEALKFCEPKDLLAGCSLVCRHWYTLSQSNEVWFQAIEDSEIPLDSMDTTAKDYYRTHYQNVYPIVTGQRLFLYSLGSYRTSTGERHWDQ